MEIITKLSPLILVLLLFNVVKIALNTKTKKPKTEDSLYAYEKKPYLFDTNAEFALYKILLELFGDQYHIFPQMHYIHLVRPRKTTWFEERRLSSHIDRKSADFVLCDKQAVVPVLVIELDGNVHLQERKKLRDENIDNLLTSVDLPILHLDSNIQDKAFIRTQVAQKLSDKTA